MFYYVKGELALTEPNMAVIDCGGVGYSLTVSSSTSSTLSRLLDKQNVKLLTHLIVREDGVELFGFYTHEELKLFKMLITVQGIGPKAAMAILSTASVTDIIKAIMNGNQKAISQAQGVGPKTAARVILELKDKFSGELGSSDGIETGEVFDIPSFSSKTKDAENALLVLGYARADIAAVLKTIDCEKYELEDIIKLALAKFMKR